MVKQHNIEPPISRDQFLCQYFVCENFEILWEISNSNLSAFPIEKPLFVKNKIFEHLKFLVSNHPSKFRSGSAWGKTYASKENYVKEYPDSQISDQLNPKFSYFEVLRTPKLEELKKFEDEILQLMLKQGMPVENFLSIAGGFGNRCGDFVFQEEYIFRKVWCSFLTIKNISDRPLAIDSVTGEVILNNEFVPYSILGDRSQVIMWQEA